MSVSDRLAHVFDHNTWLQQHSADLIHQIFACGTRLHLGKDQVAYEFGDEAQGVCLVLSGAMSTRIDDGDTGTVIAHLLGPGSIVGAATMLVPSERKLGLVGKVDTDLLFVPASALHKIASKDAQVWRFLGAVSANNVLLAQRIAQNLLIRDPALRCHAVLARLRDEFGVGNDIPLTQEELADMCVLSRGAVAAILSQMEKSGQIQRGYRKIRVY
jgi:CRP-like cAMP-binding protein